MANGKKLNVDTSIVDYLKSKGRDSSLSARAKLAKERGVVEKTSEFKGRAKQNTALLKQLKSEDREPTPTEAPTPDDVKDDKDAANHINANQDSDIDTATEKNEPATRDSTKGVLDIYDQVRDRLTPDVDVPDAPDSSAQLTEIRNEEGVGELEERLNELEKQEKDIRAETRERVTGERDKPVAMNVISGRVSEVERQQNERLNQVLREKEYVNSQLNTKYKVIEQTMEANQLDYENAVASYDTQFTQNMQMLKQVQSTLRMKRTEENRVRDNARANVQMYYNMIQDGALDVSSLPSDKKTFLTKLEVQGGIAPGTFEMLESEKPGQNIITHGTSEDADGNEFVWAMTSGEDGTPEVVRVSTGGVSSGVGDQTEDTKDFEYVDNLVKQNPDADYNELFSTAQENTELTDSEIRRRLSAQGATKDGGTNITAEKIQNGADLMWQNIEKKAKEQDTAFKWESSIREELANQVAKSLRTGGQSKALRQVFGTDELSDKQREMLAKQLEEKLNE